MAKLSRPSLMDVHFVTSGFIWHSSATELFASLGTTTYNQVFRHSVVFWCPQISKGFFFPWLDGFDTLIKFLSKVSIYQLVKYFAHKLCLSITHVLHRSIILFEFTKRPRRSKPDAHSHLLVWTFRERRVGLYAMPAFLWVSQRQHHQLT